MFMCFSVKINFQILWINAKEHDFCMLPCQDASSNKLSSKVVVPFCVLISNEWEFLLLYILFQHLVLSLFWTSVIEWTTLRVKPTPNYGLWAIMMYQRLSAVKMYTPVGNGCWLCLEAEFIQEIFVLSVSFCYDPKTKIKYTKNERKTQGQTQRHRAKKKSCMKTDEKDSMYMHISTVHAYTYMYVCVCVYFIHFKVVRPLYPSQGFWQSALLWFILALETKFLSLFILLLHCRKFVLR